MGPGYYKNKSENVKVSMIISYPVLRILNLPLYGFPLSRNFHVRTHVSFTCVNKKEAIYERPHLNVKFGRGSTFTFTRDFLCTASIFFFSRVKLTCVRPYARESYAKVDIHLEALQGSNVPLLITGNLSSVVC